MIIILHPDKPELTGPGGLFQLAPLVRNIGRTLIFGNNSLRRCEIISRIIKSKKLRTYGALRSGGHTDYQYSAPTEQGRIIDNMYFHIGRVLPNSSTLGTNALNQRIEFLLDRKG
jgi:hypothetical protein